MAVQLGVMEDDGSIDNDRGIDVEVEPDLPGVCFYGICEDLFWMLRPCQRCLVVYGNELGE